MEAVAAGRDVLAVLPTGAGKSVIYQVPAVLQEGPTLIARRWWRCSATSAPASPSAPTARTRRRQW